jgi:preprotein translocase subunit YajC
MVDFVSLAYAQNAPADAGGGPVMANLLFFGLLFAILYFLMIRPQQKQIKAHREMVENLQRGDAVVTGGGIIGHIHRIEDDVAVINIGEIEVGPKTFRPIHIRIRKATVNAVTSKGSGGAAASESSSDGTLSLDKEKR